MTSSHRRLIEGKGGKKPAIVIARNAIETTLGPLYQLKRIVVGSANPRFAVIFRSTDDDGRYSERIVATGATPNIAARRAIEGETR